MSVLLGGRGEASGYDVLTAEEELDVASEVVAAGVERLTVGGSGGGEEGSGEGSAEAVLVGDSAGEEGAAAVMGVPVEAGPDDAARVAGEVDPAVVIDIPSLLAVAASQERGAPGRGELRGDEGGGVGTSEGRLVDEEFVDGLRAGAAGDEVDDACHGAGTVEGGGGALDDLHLAEVHGRNLEQA